MKAAKIYKIVNKVNSKVYVGQTYKTIEERFSRHCAEARWKNKKKMPIVSAIHKYKAENFSIHLLEELSENTPQEIVDSREIYWGMYINTLSPNGYNLRLGNSNAAISDETKKKISLSNMGKKFSPETIQRLRISHLNHVVKESTKRKLSAKLKGIKPHANTALGASIKNAKSYTLVSPEGIITNITNMRQFCLKMNLAMNRMSELANNKITQYKGWKTVT